MNFHKQAIDIIFDRNFDANAICLRLAKEHPSIFVRFATGVESKKVNHKAKQIAKFFEFANMKHADPAYNPHNNVLIVHIIKMFRNEYSLSIVFAKRIVDYLMHNTDTIDVAGMDVTDYLKARNYL